MIQIREIRASQTHQLRIDILRKGIAENYIFKGDEDKTTFHLGAFSDDKIIGIATFIKNDYQLFTTKLSYQIRGMAINQAYQNTGIGNSVLLESYIILKYKKCNILWCNAREIAVDFYHKQNFKIIGSSFNITGIGKHFIMFKKI